MKKSNRKENLENVYQDVAYKMTDSYFYEVIESEYPKLIIKHLDTNEQFEIIIKQIKQ